jgi:ketosteroid isomerase-like protein
MRGAQVQPEETVADESAVRELRGLIEERVAAIAARDAGPLTARQYRDVLAFNVLPPLKLTGRSAVDEQMQTWFDAYRDGPHYEVHDLQVDAESNLGYCAFIYHVSGTLNDGTDVSMAVRATLVFKRISEEWLIVHDHESVPFDPQTGMALTDLQP